MIVCSCNILSDGDVKACLRPGPECPRISRSQRNLCRGRCALTIRAIMDQALSDAGVEPIAACNRGCCPTVLEKAAAEPTL